jgi:hypothetical protein
MKGLEVLVVLVEMNRSYFGYGSMVWYYSFCPLLWTLANIRAWKKQVEVRRSIREFIVVVV